MTPWMRSAAVIALLAVAACKGGGEAPPEVAEQPPESGGGESGGGSGGSGGQPGGQQPPPTYTPLSVDDTEAFRLLQQASFGSSSDDIDIVKDMGIEGWIEDQFSKPLLPYTDRIVDEHNYDGSVYSDNVQALFWERAVHGDDQLRQRVMYALSQIIVASMDHPEVRLRAQEYGVYVDLLQKHAFGNYCELVKEVSYNPVMGLYLTHLGNRKDNPEMGFVPDENYAREVMQLFTIGLEMLDPQGRPLGEETYTVDDIQGLAAIFTGLSWADTDFDRPRVDDKNRFLPMESFRAHHEDDPKTFLGYTVDLGNDAVNSIDAALEHLLSHQNVAPFVTKQLIQKLVTSNPSPEYVGRVGAAFEAGQYTMPDGTTVGTGQRCDMQATIAAILTDEEARGIPTDENFGKIRNPVLSLSSLLRAYRVKQAVSTSGAIPVAWGLDRLEEQDRFGINAFVSPSVFNFYRPGYVGPGTDSAEEGLVTPEYQLATTSSMVGYVNVMEDYVDGPRLIDGAVNVAVVDYSELEAIAHDPDALVDRLDRDLMGGMLSEANRREIVDAVAVIQIRSGDNEEHDRRRRTQAAMMMTIVSPEFLVQR